MATTGDAAVYALCVKVLLVSVVAVLFIRRRRRHKDILCVPFVEVLKNYKPGKILDLHWKYAKQTYPRCWYYPVPLHTPLICTVNVDVVKHVLVSNFENYEKGPAWRGIFQDLLGDGIFNADGEKWRKSRKVSAHEFSVNSLKNFMHGVFESRGAETLALIRPGEAVDAQALFAQYTLQTIGQIGFGIDLGALDGAAGKRIADDFGDAFNNATQLSGDRTLDPLWKVKRLFGIGSEARLRMEVARVRAFSNRVIEDRRGEAVAALREMPDLLSRFMVLADATATGKWRFSNEDLHFAVINFVLAGRDTTANQLTWALYELSRKPECVARIRAEGGADTAYASITRRGYLKAVLTEALRLHPSVPLDIKQAVKADVLPDGTAVAAGDRVVYIPWAMGRMAELWDDPLAFRPERFLDGDGAFKFPPPTLLPVFQAGPRTCLGKDVAYLGAAMLLARILDAYDVALAPGQGEPVYDTGLTLWVDGPMSVVFAPRVDA